MIIDIKYDQTHLLNTMWHSLDSTPNVLKLIMEHGYRIIHLIRKNLVARQSSFLLAKASGVWVNHNWQSEAAVADKVTVDLSELRNGLIKDHMRIQFFNECFNGYPHILNLYYEDLLKNGMLNMHANRLANFLEQPVPTPEQFRPATRKIAPKMKDYIANFNDVAKELKGTPFAAMLLD